MRRILLALVVLFAAAALLFAPACEPTPTPPQGKTVPVVVHLESGEQIYIGSYVITP